MFQDDEILREFVVESAEHLADVESQLLEIEDGGANINNDLVNTVFRAIHSVKGAAGFLGLVKINELAHNLENVLNLIRNQELVPSHEVIDRLLRSADLLRNMVNDVEASNGFDVSLQVEELKQILTGDFTNDSETQDVAHSLVEVVETVTSAVAGQRPSKSAEPSTAVEPSLNSPVPSQAQSVPGEVKPKAESSPDSKAAQRVPESNVRVNVAILDRLMNLAGELVLGRNQLLQSINSHCDHDHLSAVAARLDQVTSELQEAIMQTRMQPVGAVFNRFPRVVRDLSAKLRKNCDLEIEGGEVEIDKTIIEAIGDPLTHLIRNSVDHGIELPAKRTAAGKKPEGLIRLRAFHQAGKVCIRIEDNGAGIDPARIKSKALSNGLISEAEAAAMSLNDTLRLIFAPGFSTAAEVTDVSGRGVGMDVVKTNIEQIGGTVDIESELGVGSAIHITLPLTLAIIPSMIIGCGEDKFAIPQTNISELVRVPAVECHERIGQVQGAEVLRLRGALLPLVRLSKLFNSDLDAARGPFEDNGVEDAPRNLNVIVVESGQYRYGVAVDALYDSEEIVVKPLGRQLKELNYLAGATILGDGRVALILDITGIALHASLRSCEELNEAEDDAANGALAADIHRLLLFANAPTEHFAIPMACVSRIERTATRDIIEVGGRLLLPYRGSTLPLLALEEYITAKPRETELEHLFVIVFAVSNREVGLIAPSLNDICNVDLQVDDSVLREPGVAGVLVIDEHPTRLLDLMAISRTAHPEWAEQTPQVAEATSKHILIAEDSAFFRRHVQQTLTDEGYTVTAAEDGQEGWEKLQEMNPLPDLVVTDVEMPRMSGLDLCKAIRGDQRTHGLPVIALTSLASDADIARGKAVGIDDYQVKLDKANLLTAIAHYIKIKR